MSALPGRPSTQRGVVVTSTTTRSAALGLLAMVLSGCTSTSTTHGPAAGHRQCGRARPGLRPRPRPRPQPRRRPGVRGDALRSVPPGPERAAPGRRPLPGHDGLHHRRPRRVPRQRPSPAHRTRPPAPRTRPQHRPGPDLAAGFPARSGRLPRPDRRSSCACCSTPACGSQSCARLELTDVDLDRELAYVTGKGSRPRVVPLGAKTAQALDRYLRVCAPHPHARSPRLLLGQASALDGEVGTGRSRRGPGQ
jgi:hypothetical protein